MNNKNKNAVKDIKIIPVVMVVILIAFSARFVDVYTGFDALDIRAFAASDKKEKKKKDDHKDEEEHAEEGSKDDDHGDEKMAEKKKSSKKKDDGIRPWRDSNEEDFGYNSVKQEHIQDLNTRKDELNKKEKDIKTREALVMAATQEMDRKLLELKKIRGEIEILLDTQQDQEQGQLTSLVKIYEGMKAKEAAAIFNTLDLDILVEVIARMSERKVSPVLAAMNPERAKTVTIMLAERKKLPVLVGAGNP